MNNFNTSNVTIQPPALKFLNQFLSNFNTSNVTIQPNRLCYADWFS